MDDLRPLSRVQSLKRRSLSELDWLGRISRLPHKVVYDTSFYIDQLQERFPAPLLPLLSTAAIFHSTVAASELANLMGILDPRHPGTARAVDQIRAALTQFPADQALVPDHETWIDAGVLSGSVARLQQYAAADRRRVLNDALIFCTARRHGCAVLTRNIADFDFLQQLDPRVGVLFYERA